MKKKTITLLLLKFLKIGTTVLNLSLIAKFFGVSLERDSWLLAFNAIMIFDLAIWGAINETFRTKFIFLKETEGPEFALEKTRSLLLFIFLISSIMVTTVMFFPELPAKIIAPTFSGDKHQLLLKMLVLIAPCFLINQATLIGISILNAYESYFIPEISGFISTLVSIVLLLIFAPYIGIYALFISHYLSMLMLLGLVVFQIKKFQIPIFSNYKNVNLKGFSIFFLFALPFFFPYFVGQLSSIIEKSIASSMGNGVVSIIDYSKKFCEIFIGVLTSVLTTMLIPVLSLKFIQKKNEEFVAEFINIFQIGFFVLIATIALFNACPDAFITILYQSKKMTQTDFYLISDMAQAFSWSAMGVFFYLVFGLVLLSSDKPKIYAGLGLVAQVLNIIFYITLSKYFGIFIFPMSLFLSHFVCGIFMLKNFPVKTNIINSTLIKNFAVLFITVGIMYSLNKFLPFPSDAFIKLFLNISLLSLLLLAELFIFQFEERFFILRIFKRIFK